MDHENRIFICFGFWLVMGVTWGCLKQHWDPISAMATGGLTAPPVAADGILPGDDAIFVGCYCLVGIPLFALALSKGARLVVQSHHQAAERRAIATPMRQAEFELAKSLFTDDDHVNLGEFMVLHLM